MSNYPEWRTETRTFEPRLTYTIDEAAALLGIGRNSAYQAAKRGEIPTIRIGKRLLVPRVRLEALVAGTPPDPHNAPVGPQDGPYGFVSTETDSGATPRLSAAPDGAERG